MSTRWIITTWAMLGVFSGITAPAQVAPLPPNQQTVSQIPAFQEQLPGRAQELAKIAPLKNRSSILNPQAVELVQEKAKADAIAAMRQLSREERDAARLVSARSARQIQIAIQQKPTPKISNGRQAAVGQIPYQVALVFAGYQNPAQGFFCGGSIIGSTWILTAAHCFQSNTLPGDIEVYVGAIKLSSGGSLIPVKHLFPHPSFNRQSMENDIALLELTKATDGLAPVALVPSPADEASILALHNMVVISGWGDTFGGSHTGSDVLLFANIPLVTPSTCGTAAPGEIATTMICAGDGASDSCEGDSGGPLTIAGTDNQRYQEGVVSWGTNGEQCGQPGVYGVYTRVPSFAAWIKTTMGLSSN
jgi:secreted trypsin-like serine protease